MSEYPFLLCGGMTCGLRERAKLANGGQLTAVSGWRDDLIYLSQRTQRAQSFSYNNFYSLSAKLVPQAAKSAKGWRDVYVHCRVKGHVHFIILAAFSNPHGPIIFVSCRYHASFAERWLAFSDEGNGWV